jgi:hypothetical protein
MKMLWIAAVVATTSTAHADPHSPYIGVMTDVGVPDGANASLAIRPVRPLRVEIGAAHNAIGPGVRAGATWIPLSSWATPVIGVGYGRFFDRDANPIARTVSGDPTFSSPLLDRVGYDFATARAGVELGRKHVTFFIHAGLTRVTTDVHGIDQVSSGDSMVTVSTTDPHVTLWTVSADLGFVVYLY